MLLTSERPAGLESGCGAVSNPVGHLMSEAFKRCCLGEVRKLTAMLTVTASPHCVHHRIAYLYINMMTLTQL